MSGNSSEEETIDGLDIKPPQHVHSSSSGRHHKERKRDRSSGHHHHHHHHKHPKSHRSSSKNANANVNVSNSESLMSSSESGRRQLLSQQQQQQHYQREMTSTSRDRRGDGGHHSSRQQQRYQQQQQQQGDLNIPQVGRERDRSSSSRKYHDQDGIPRSKSSGSRFVVSASGEDHSEGSGTTGDLRHKLARDKRSKDLREAMEKRKRLEMENEKALREIERRREQERISEDSEGGSGGGGGGGRSSKVYKDKKMSSSSSSKKYYEDRKRTVVPEEEEEESPSPDNKKKSRLERLETEELEEHVNIEIQDIEESSSELEEGEERTPHPGGIGIIGNQESINNPNENSERSNVSSASSMDNDNRRQEHQEDDERMEEDEPSKVTSDVSSTTSSSRKSDDDGRSDVSSSSSSSGDDDSGEDSGEDNKVERGKQKLNGKNNQDDEEPSRPAKMARRVRDSPGSPKEIGGGSPEQQNHDLSRGVENNIPTVIVTADDEDEKDLLPPYLPAVQGCRRVEEFSLLNRIEEGTYGVVYRAKDKRTDEIVALKRLKMEKEKDGFPITSLREINTLLKAQHENIVTVREIVVGSNTDKIFLVMDYVEHDLKALMETLKQKGQVFLPEEVKCLMIQLLRAVAHMHDNWILHRDLKTSNLLLSHKGILKVGDFGLAREYGSPLKQYTPIVVTLWYRAPELLLGGKEYSCPIDVWSVGCIFGELLKMEPMFPGKSEANQLNLIFQSLGTPNDRIWPGYSQMPLLQKITFADYPVNKLKTRFGHLTEQGIDLMNCFLKFNPAKRITAEDALSHPFFKEAPLAINPSMFPTWPAKSEMGHRKAPASPKPPSGGQQFKGLKEDEDSQGFFLGGNDARRHNLGGGFSLKF